MPNTARQFNGTSVVAVIHDPLLGELQITVAKPRSAPPPCAAAVPADVCANRIAPAANHPTGPPVTSRSRASGKGGRYD